MTDFEEANKLKQKNPPPTIQRGVVNGDGEDRSTVSINIKFWWIGLAALIGLGLWILIS